MNDTWVTVVGNLATEPSVRTTGGGIPVANLRVATTPRRRDGVTGEWKDAETAFLTVTCWRALAEHVSRSLHKGDPVVVHGRLVHKSYETAQGERRTSTEVEASALGPDLARGTAAFARAGRARPTVTPRADAPGSGARWAEGEGAGHARSEGPWEAAEGQPEDDAPSDDPWAPAAEPLLSVSEPEPEPLTAGV